jgi:hypothetical protein
MTVHPLPCHLTYRTNHIFNALIFNAIGRAVLAPISLYSYFFLVFYSLKNNSKAFYIKEAGSIPPLLGQC